MSPRIEKPRWAKNPCACGCGQHPRNRQATYIKGHGPFSSPVERLWERVQKGGPDDCWPWPGAHSGGGHGQIKVGGRRGRLLGTHVVAWESAHGPVPAGMVIRHTCDNPPCCNPAHLLVGTQGNNVQDAYDRNRMPVGELHSSAKLSDADVRYIRSNYVRWGNSSNAPQLAEEFGIHRDYVTALVRGVARRSA